MGMIIVRRCHGVLALNTVVVRKAAAFLNLNIISVIRQCCLLLHPATITNGVADENPFVFLPFCTLFMLNQAKMSGGTSCGGGGGGGDDDSVVFVLQRYN